MCLHYIVVKISVESMSLPPVSTLERRAPARAAVRNQMEPTGHSLEFRPEERVGLLRCRIRRWLREHFNALNLVEKIANFIVNLMSNYMVWMTIAS